MKKSYAVEVMTEYFILDKENEFETVFETENLCDALIKAGDTAEMMIRGGMVVDEAYIHNLSLESSNYPNDEGVTKNIHVIDLDEQRWVPLEYGFICSAMSRENAVKVVGKMVDGIMKMSGHNVELKIQ